MRKLLPAIALSTVLALPAHALMPYPLENQTDIPDGLSGPFVGHWSVRIVGQPDKTIATCATPLTIEPTGPNSISYRAPSDPEAEMQLIAEDGRTTWRSSVEGGGFLAVWTEANSFYLYDEAAPDLGGPYAFTRCPQP